MKPTPVRLPDNIINEIKNGHQFIIYRAVDTRQFCCFLEELDSNGVADTVESSIESLSTTLTKRVN